MALLTYLSFSFIVIDDLTCKKDVPDSSHVTSIFALVSKSSPHNLDSFIIMNEYSSAFDVGYVSLAPAQYEQLGNLQPGSLVLVLVFHLSSTPLIDIRLVCIYLH